jgi:hypothetical protein
MVILAKVTLFAELSVKYIVKSFALLGQLQYILLTILQKGNFSKDHHKLPEDGPNGPKHVGANV